MIVGLKAMNEKIHKIEKNNKWELINHPNFGFKMKY